jgi:TonB family protein
MHNLRLFLLFLLCSFLCPAKFFAQGQPSASTTPSATASDVKPVNPTTPEEFFARARQLSDLEAAGIPFHLKATYVATGDSEFTGNGTYEEWWRSKDDWRKETTLGDHKYVAIQKAGKQTSFATSTDVPTSLRQVLDAILIRMPSDTDGYNGWKLHHKEINGLELTVLSRKHPCSGKSEHSKKDACAQQYYFSPEGQLRIHFVGTIETRYNGFKTFQNDLVPRDIDVSSDAATSTITVNSVEPLSSYPETLPGLAVVTPAHQQGENTIRADEAAMGARLVHQVPPSYPIEAQRKRIQGTVTLSAIIDKNGNVQKLQVIHSAGTLLDNAALQVVREWQYKPTIFEGQAVNVNTTISVVFRLSD